MKNSKFSTPEKNKQQEIQKKAVYNYNNPKKQLIYSRQIKLNQTSNVGKSKISKIFDKNMQIIESFKQKASQLRTMKRSMSVSKFNKSRKKMQFIVNPQKQSLQVDCLVSSGKGLSKKSNHQQLAQSHLLAKSIENVENQSLYQEFQKQQKEIIPNDNKIQEFISPSEAKFLRSQTQNSSSSHFNRPQTQNSRPSLSRFQSIEKIHKMRYEQQLQLSKQRISKSKIRLLQSQTFFKLQQQKKKNQLLLQKQQRLNQLIYHRLQSQRQKQSKISKRRQQQRFIHQSKMVKIEIQRRSKQSSHRIQNILKQNGIQQTLLTSQFNKYLKQKQEIQQQQRLIYKYQFLKNIKLQKGKEKNRQVQQDRQRARSAVSQGTAII